MPRCCVPECTSGTFRDRKSLRDAGARDRSYFAFPKVGDTAPSFVYSINSGNSSQLLSNSQINACRCRKFSYEINCLSYFPLNCLFFRFCRILIYLPNGRRYCSTRRTRWSSTSTARCASITSGRRTSSSRTFSSCSTAAVTRPIA